MLHKKAWGCSSPSSRPWAHKWRTTNVCDTWPVRRQTYGYLSSRKASPPVGWYQIILLGDRGTCVNNLWVALDNGAAGIRTRDLLITSPASYRYTTEPHIWRQCMALNASCFTLTVYLATTTSVVDVLYSIVWFRHCIYYRFLHDTRCTGKELIGSNKRKEIPQRSYSHAWYVFSKFLCHVHLISVLIIIINSPIYNAP